MSADEDKIAAAIDARDAEWQPASAMDGATTPSPRRSSAPSSVRSTEMPAPEDDRGTSDVVPEFDERDEDEYDECYKCGGALDRSGDLCTVCYEEEYGDGFSLSSCGQALHQPDPEEK